MKITIDIKVVDGIYYIRETNQLYSGPYVLYYKNGQKESKVVIKGGKENGLHRWWYENGQKSKEGTYKDGKQVELVTSWYENGQKGKEGTFKDGELVSENCWDIDGNDIDCD